jgi:thioredoxin
MRKIFLAIAAFSVIFASCENATGKQSGDSNSKPGSSVSVNQDSNAGGSVLLTKAVFLQKVWNYEQSPKEWKYLGDKPAIIDFYADWCGPCRIASPILEEVSHEFAGKINVYKIDTQREQELAQVFGITGIPAFLYIPTGGAKPVMMSGIARSKEETKAMFIDNIEKILQVKK